MATEILHDAGARLFPVVLDAGLKGVVLLAVAWAVARLLRRRSAAVRHLGWALGLAGLLVLPATLLLGPKWTLDLLPEPAHISRANPLREAVELRPANEIAPEKLEPSRPSTSSGESTEAFRSADAESGRVREENARRGAEVSTPPVATVAGPPSASTHVPRTSSVRRDPLRGPLRGWLAAIWSIGAAGILGRWAVGRLALAWLARGARPAGGEWEEELRAIRRAMRVRRPVRLLLMGDAERSAATPMTWGWARPVVLLPADARAWPAERRREVLAHELAHVARWDALTGDLARLAAALHWFNPLAWFAVGRMRVEREQACDDAVLALGGRASDYAGTLVAIAGRFGSEHGGERATPAGAMAMARGGGLEDRVRAILSPDGDRRAVGPWVLAAGLLLAAASVVPLLTVAMAALPGVSPRLDGAYEKAPGSSSGSIRVGPNKFRIQSVHRVRRDGSSALGDGLGTNGDTLLYIGPAHVLPPEQAAWLDQATIQFGVDPRGMDVGLLYDVIETRVFDRATREFLQSDGDAGTRYGWSQPWQGSLQLRAIGGALPNEVDVWMRVASHEDTNDRVLLQPKTGESFGMAEGTLSVREARDGQWSYAYHRGAPIAWHDRMAGQPEGSTIVLDWKGKWVEGRYQICVADRKGGREFPNVPHFIDFSRTSGPEIVHFKTPLDEISWIELRPFGGRHVFYFDGVKLPKTDAPPSPPPAVRFDVGGHPFDRITKSLDPLEMEFALAEGIVSSLGADFEGPLTPERLIESFGPVLEGAEGVTLGYRVAGIGLRLDDLRFEFFDREGRPAEAKQGGNASRGEVSGLFGVRTFHVPIERIDTVVVHLAAQTSGVVAASGAAPSLYPSSPPVFAIYRVEGTANAIEAAKTPLAELKLEGEPLLTNQDIVEYNWSDHSVRVGPGVVDRMLPKRPDLRGIPFVVTVDGERIYMGAFWTGYSSFSFDGPEIYQENLIDRVRADGTYEHNLFKIRGAFGDVRSDERIRAALERVGALTGVVLHPGFAIYPVTGGLNAQEARAWALEQLPLEGKPLLTEADVVAADWETQTLRLKPGVIERLPRRPPDPGLPFVVVAGGERIYLGAFWWGLSKNEPTFPTIRMPESGKSVRPDGTKIQDTIWIEPLSSIGAGVQGAADMRLDARVRRAWEAVGPAADAGKQPDMEWLKAFRAAKVADEDFQKVAFKVLVEYDRFIDTVKDPLSDDPGYPTRQRARTAVDWKALEASDHYRYRAGYAEFLEGEFRPKMATWFDNLSHKEPAAKGRNPASDWMERENFVSTLRRAVKDGRKVLGPRRYLDLSRRYTEQTAPPLLDLMDRGLDLFKSLPEDDARTSSTNGREFIAGYRANILPQLRRMQESRAAALSN